MRRIGSRLLLVSAIAVMVSLTACRREDEGAAERTGRAIDDAMEKSAEEMDAAGRKLGEAMDKAGQQMGRAMEEAGRKMQDKE